ncbi:MAG: hypothetical protein C5B49_09215 [Bdellovibrio sp.]|nr:MAG: hypothetical protein C5B49_09215 [Bdellovibrio sp.]
MRIGIDLGGTKTELVAIDAHGRQLLRERQPTPATDYQAILANIRSMVESAERRLASTASVGIGIPGTLSIRTGLVKNANTVCLIGKPLKQDLEASLRRPVRLANDANCFALSEACAGAGVEEEVVFGVILGTGVGGGIVVHGQIINGINSVAGEWGHNPLPWPRDDERPGPRCYCGKSGCIEAFLAGPRLEQVYQEKTGRAFSATQIAEQALQGDSHAEEILQLYEDRIARALASVIDILDPNVIILGGGLSKMERLYTRVPLLWGSYVFSDSVETKLRPAKFGDSSGVIGAAWLWPAAGLAPASV